MTDSLTSTLIIVSIVFFLIFLLLRELNCWYWKINDIIKILSRIEAKLSNQEIVATATLQPNSTDLAAKKSIKPTEQKVTETKIILSETKKVKCPKCGFSEDVLFSEISSNSAFHNFEAHLDSNWEPSLRCPKCHKKFAFFPRSIKPDIIKSV